MTTGKAASTRPVKYSARIRSLRTPKMRSVLLQGGPERYHYHGVGLEQFCRLDPRAGTETRRLGRFTLLRRTGERHGDEDSRKDVTCMIMLS